MLSSDPAEFLARCAEQVRQVYQYWKDKCAGRTMPQRRDVDPLDIARHLPNITLVDVVPDTRRYVYRVVGTREVDARGADPTGHSVLDSYFCSSRDAALVGYDRVCSERRPLFRDGQFFAESGRRTGRQTIFLPLSVDGETVSQIMIYSLHGP